jgi:hypothetical protein
MYYTNASNTNASNTTVAAVLGPSSQFLTSILSRVGSRVVAGVQVNRSC